MPTTRTICLRSRTSAAWTTTLMMIAAILLPTAAFAHPGHAKVHCFQDGISHPLSGLDHCCAMIAIGIWAAQTGGRAYWLAPLISMAFMVLGGSIGMKAGAVPFIEQGIVTSVLVLGLLIAVTRKLPLPEVLATIGLFAAIHGFAHGMELPKSSHVVAYGTGILLSSLILQVTAIAATSLVLKLGQQRIVRLGGALITLCGVVLFFQQR